MLTLAALLIACVDVAHAAFPGANGKIAFSRDGDVYTVNPDGSGETQLTSAPEDEIYPAWSPDGQELAYSTGGSIKILTVGTGALTTLTPIVGNARDPSWSADGLKLAFIGGLDNVYSMNVDGTSVTQLTFDGNGGAPTSNFDPVWSPDGAKIAFHQCSDDGECLALPGLRVMNSNGSGVVEIGQGEHADWSPAGDKLVYSLFGQGLRTINPDGSGSQPVPGAVSEDCCAAWSPSATKLAFPRFPVEPCFDQLYTMNVDGSARQPLVCGFDPDWQPLVSSYPRPNGAAKVRVTFVPAMRRCTTANTSHGGPLDRASCSPAHAAGGYAAVKNDDSSLANGSASYRYICTNGTLGDPTCGAAGDQADVALNVRHTDVRTKGDLSLDYSDELEARVIVRITDSFSDDGNGKATVADAALSVAMPCTTTPADSSIGSTCAVVTGLDAVAPGIVLENKRATWGLGQIRFYDGGSDGDADTTTDNTLFAVEGIAIP